MGYYFQIIIDVTGSMDIWVYRLRKQIFEFIQMCNFVDFKKICIISYTDYNNAIPIISSDWQDLNSNLIEDFCENINIGSGGGFCECFKTAIIHVTENLPPLYDVEKDHIYVLHITDSGPHNNSINIESMINNINWKRIELSLEYINYNLYKKSKFCKLDREGVKEKRALKEKFEWSYIVEKCLETNIIFNCITPCLEYFGCDLITKTNGYGYYHKNMNDNILSEIICAWFFNTSFGHYEELSLSFQHNFDNIGKDIIITDKFFDNINVIINTNIMLLTCNKMFGKVWRKLCKCRKHSLRNITIENMIKHIRLLNDNDKQIFTEFQKESYNNTDEINAIIAEKDYKMILTYNSDINETMSSQDVSRLFLDLGENNQRIITNFTNRLSIRSGDVLKPGEIPYDINIEDLFSIIFHTMVPGTLITGQFSIMTFAMLARKSILKDKALYLLKKNIGKWLHFDFESEECITPMMFNHSYLKLLHHNKDILSNKELEIIDKLIYLNLFYLLKQVQVPIKCPKRGSMDKFYPVHMAKCSKCNKDRPLSLLPSVECVYCIWNCEPKTLMTPERCFMACCNNCSSFYSRDPDVDVMGQSKCHACFNNTEPSTKTCSKCKHKFIMYRDMPYGQCRNCLLNNDIRKPELYEYVKTFSTIFNDDLLLQYMKIECSNTKTLYNMYKTHKNIDNIDIQKQYYNNREICNMNEVYDVIKTSIETKIIERKACDICCDDTVSITPACGRSKCSQGLCNDCGKQWYGENKKGCLVDLRHMTCMFCNREPIYKIIKRWGSDDIVRVQKLPEINNAYYYAWCIKCNAIKYCGARECGDEPPPINNFICEDCTVAQPTDFKNCPQCEHPTILTSGCNHITCVCGAHWCFVCRKLCTSNTIYDHLQREHGGIYGGAYGDDYNDDYYDDNDY